MTGVPMRILLVGAGGVGGAFAAIAARRDFFERIVVADYDLARAERARDGQGADERFVAARIDASSADSVAALVRDHERLVEVPARRDRRERATDASGADQEDAHAAPHWPM